MAYQPGLIGDRLIAGSSLSRGRVTDRPSPPTVFGVPTDWPAETFRKLVRDLMDAAGIVDYAELSRLSGVSQTQLSLWRRGLAQPSRESLKEVAPVLNVAPVRLYLAAGIMDASELELDDTPDFRVLPTEFLDLADLYESLDRSDDRRVFLRRSVAALVAGMQAESPSNRGRPTGRRRAG